MLNEVKPCAEVKAEPGDDMVADDMMKQLELLLDPHKKDKVSTKQYVIYFPCTNIFSAQKHWVLPLVMTSCGLNAKGVRSNINSRFGIFLVA